MNRRNFLRAASAAAAGAVLMPWGELWVPRTIITVPANYGWRYAWLYDEEFNLLRKLRSKTNAFAIPETMTVGHIIFENPEGNRHLARTNPRTMAMWGGDELIITWNNPRRTP